jgi:hypothetical protein
MAHIAARVLAEPRACAALVLYPWLKCSQEPNLGCIFFSRIRASPHNTPRPSKFSSDAPLLDCSMEQNLGHVFLAMSAYFDRDTVALPGIAKFFRVSRGLPTVLVLVSHGLFCHAVLHAPAPPFGAAQAGFEE